MPEFLKVKVQRGRGQVLPIKGKATGRFYGYYARNEVIEIDRRDYDYNPNLWGLIRPEPHEPVKVDISEDETAGVSKVGSVDLTAIKGIGDKLAALLGEAGVTTFDGLVEFGVSNLAQLPGMTEAKAFDVIAQAIDLNVESEDAD